MAENECGYCALISSCNGKVSNDDFPTLAFRLLCELIDAVNASSGGSSSPTIDEATPIGGELEGSAITAIFQDLLVVTGELRYLNIHNNLGFDLEISYDGGSSMVTLPAFQGAGFPFGANFIYIPGPIQVRYKGSAPSDTTGIITAHGFQV